MGFASTYLAERVLFPQLINEAPDKDTGIIVVVPAYNEPDIKILLDSLAICIKPDCEVEVIIIINAPSSAPDEHIENNLRALKNIESWKRENRNSFFRLFAFDTGKPVISNWGVGLARKTGMDEAVRRFNFLNRPEGVILNLDADCLVERNYFVSVCNKLKISKDRTACSIYFEHPLEGGDFPEHIYRYITLYELHLRYYFQGLKFTGFPYVFHTVGSSLAVKALQYVRSGGMNRRQAGEDFYFIQKLVPSGGYFTLNSTTIYPSPRASLRVPFGTGASVEKMTEGNSITFYSYSLDAFNELRDLFSQTEKLYHINISEVKGFYKLLPIGLSNFISEKEWEEKLAEVKNNTSGIISFKKRFFSWFNMFKIVKYLNFVHKDIFEKKPAEVLAFDLLQVIGISIDSKDPFDLLLYFRSMEKNSGNSDT